MTSTDTAHAGNADWLVGNPTGSQLASALWIGSVGLLILGTALVTEHDPAETILPEQREWRGWACILAGPVLFIVLGQYLGMAAGTFGCVFVSALGDRTATVKSSAILAVIVTVFGCLLFAYVLKLAFPIFKWGY